MSEPSPRGFTRTLLLSSLAILTSLPALAQDRSQEITVPTVVITATRSPEAIARVGSAVTVITAEEIARKLELRK